ncbi:hypothetical protein KIN20_023314 [Parelaphostrongylus tenuis]|uniref:Uncharacterized protein n=1 Tax=Parelaphostrongylus tenuis TaxID=148309 RepID=A0AAD5MRJ8_PARTN|nr:hypothetical protein KIN20_023314 [Parelaphostrongylus tenuis]
MEVPEHISVSGEPIERRERTDNSTPFLRQEESAVKLMNVPDHIALTGGDGYRAIISQPSDLIGSHMSHDKQVNYRIFTIFIVCSVRDECVRRSG